jgi:hypothetical protein
MARESVNVARDSRPPGRRPLVALCSRSILLIFESGDVTLGGGARDQIGTRDKGSIPFA